jgi:hypothetical protein
MRHPGEIGDHRLAGDVLAEAQGSSGLAVSLYVADDRISTELHDLAAWDSGSFEPHARLAGDRLDDAIDTTDSARARSFIRLTICAPFTPTAARSRSA